MHFFYLLVKKCLLFVSLVLENYSIICKLSFNLLFVYIFYHFKIVLPCIIKWLSKNSKKLY